MTALRTAQLWKSTLSDFFVLFKHRYQATGTKQIWYQAPRDKCAGLIMMSIWKRISLYSQYMQYAIILSELAFRKMKKNTQKSVCCIDHRL